MQELDKSVFFKPTGAVQITNKFTLLERKLLNAIIWHHQRQTFYPAAVYPPKQPLKPPEYSLPMRDVFRFLGLEKSENYEIVKAALRVLTSTIVEWNIFGYDRVQEWGVCTFLASGKITGGKLKYRLNPELIEQIDQPALFAKIHLPVQSQVKKRNALVLYEFLLDLLFRSRKDSLRFVVELDKLYLLLGAGEDTSFKFFNRDVLKTSAQEICINTDIEVTYETLRTQRKVSAIAFTVTKKESFQASFGPRAILPAADREVPIGLGTA